MDMKNAEGTKSIVKTEKPGFRGVEVKTEDIVRPPGFGQEPSRIRPSGVGWGSVPGKNPSPSPAGWSACTPPKNTSIDLDKR